MPRSFPLLSKIAASLSLTFVVVGLCAPGFALAQATPPTTPPSVAPATPPATTVPSPAADETVPAETPAPRPFTPIAPNPAVPIPGVRFTAATEQDGEVSIPYLAQYISGIYRLSVGLGAILAAIMIVYGGFRYMLSASLPEVETGKKIIQDAVVGLVVLLTSFLILKTINPKLVEMNPIRVQRIQEEAPITQTGEMTGNPAATGFDAGLDGLGCGGGASGRTETLDGVTFSVLPLRKSYEQGNAPWGNISYGQNLTNNESLTPCKGDGRGGDGYHQPVVNGCTQTFKNGGCGPTAFATIMAYYGLRVTNAGDAALAAHVRVWNGDELVDLAAHPRGQTVGAQLQARVGSHLFDPIDAGRLIISQGHGGSGGTAVTTRVPSMEGFQNTAVRGSAAAAAAIRSGKPLIFYCAHCMLKLNHITDPDHQGGQHFMVVHGVSQDNQWFLVQDSGGGGSAGGKFLSAAEVDTGMNPAHPTQHRVSFTAVTPTTATTQACNTANDGQPTHGGGTPSTAGDVSLSATTGEVTRTGFNYHPAGGDGGWDAGSPSQIFFPQRLGTAFGSGSSRPRIHLYIFIHGLNSHGTTLEQSIADSGSWVSSITSNLNQIAGSKNVVVAAPYYVNGGGHSYMSHFNLESFYTAAVAAMSSSMRGFQESDIADVVIGGHSAATCQGPGSPVLRQALVPTLGGHRVLGIVLYDGCTTDSVLNARNFTTPPGVSLLFNPDFRSISDGMGIHSTDATPPVFVRARYADIRTQWELPRMACPTYVENQCPMDTPPVEPSAPRYDQRRCNACYGRTVDGKQIVSFETVYGHRQSVLHMTKYAFRAFYGN